MVSLNKAILNFVHNRRKTLIFAITPICNCKCDMCDMHTYKPEKISLENAKRVIDFASENGFSIVYFTGGEPTLHPDLPEMIGYANDYRLVTSLTTNGTKPYIIPKLKEVGLDVLSVSFDHYSPEICERIRHYPGIQKKQEETIKLARELRLKIYALLYPNEYLQENGSLRKFASYIYYNLRVPWGFCFPTDTRVNGSSQSDEGAVYQTTYRLGGSAPRFSKEIQLKMMKEFLALKREGHKIVNPTPYIEETIRSLEGRPPKFYCKGGEKVAYADWHGDFYPCFIKHKLFNINDNNKQLMKDVKCNDCLINCFWEPSLLNQGFLGTLEVLAKEVLYSPSVLPFYV